MAYRALLLFILVSKQLRGGGGEGKGSKIKNGSKINFFSLIVCNFCTWSNGSDRILPRPIRVFTFSGYKNVTERERERVVGHWRSLHSKVTFIKY